MKSIRLARAHEFHGKHGVPLIRLGLTHTASSSFAFCSDVTTQDIRWTTRSEMAASGAREFGQHNPHAAAIA